MEWQSDTDGNRPLCVEQQLQQLLLRSEQANVGVAKLDRCRRPCRQKMQIEWLLPAILYDFVDWRTFSSSYRHDHDDDDSGPRKDDAVITTGSTGFVQVLSPLLCHIVSRESIVSLRACIAPRMSHFVCVFVVYFCLSVCLWSVHVSFTVRSSLKQCFDLKVFTQPWQT